MRVKFGTKVVVTVALSVLLGGGFLYLSAVPIAASGIPTFDAANFAQWIKQFLDQKKLTFWKKAGIKSLEKATERFVNRMAYEAANFLLEGGAGGKSLKRRESFGRILRRTGESALGDFMQDLSAIDAGDGSLNSLGLNLCNPSVQLKASISLQLLDAVKPPPIGTGGCDVSEIKENWKKVAQSAEVTGSVGFGNSFGVTTSGTQGKCQWHGEDIVDENGGLISCSTSAECEVHGGTDCKIVSSGVLPFLNVTQNMKFQDRLKFVNDWFSPTQSELSAYTTIKNENRERVQRAATLAAAGYQTCPETYDNVAKIDLELVKTNCEELKRLGVKTEAPDLGQEAIKAQSSGELSLFKNAARIFGSTLIAGLLKKYIRAGSFSLSAIPDEPDLASLRADVVEQLRTGGVSSGRLLVGGEVAFNSAQLRRPTLDRIDDYDYLSVFSTCPDNRNQVELDNCTLDGDFAAAIRDKLTVAEAIAEGRLRADLPLLSNLNTALNSDPFCYRNGYCHSNLVRMRKYRIVPIGWEIAASLSPIDDPVSLGEAVDCFDNNSKCKFDPETNIYFRLIDPNWVIKAPETQCKALGFGPKLIDIDSDERQQYCTDPVSCLGEDDLGNCTGGFGYCTRERNIWRFAGDQCPADFASCRTYTRTSDSRQAGYLARTVDTCDADEVGCLWYSKSQDNVGSVDAPVYEWNPNDRIYLNREVLECPADQAGCSEFISVVSPGVNLAANGDFEYFTGNPASDFFDPDWLEDALVDSFTGWQGNASVFTTRVNAYQSSLGMRLGGAGSYSTNVTTGILADRTYTLSWYGRWTDATAGECTADISISSVSTPAQSTTVTYTAEWKRFNLATSFDVTNLDTSVLVTFTSPCLDALNNPHDLYIDEMKFELNDTASPLSPYGETGFVHLKSQNQCSKSDVGCDRYTPANGGFSVPGQINSNDLCPVECVGYQNYLELVSLFDVFETGGSDTLTPRSVDFIATTAKSCPASQVDCEEFTNLEEVEQGGEGIHYYSFIRQCVEDPLGVTYYTLEGNDTAGYQVRTWRLLPSNLVLAPGAPSSPAGGILPCTHVNAGGSECFDSDGSIVDTTCLASDLNTNLDCREFFDIDGNPHYILQSRVIVASTECQAFRRSQTGVIFFALGRESRACKSEFNGCREYRGNQANNVRTVAVDNFESGGVAPWDTTTSAPSAEAVTNGGASMSNENAVGNPTALLTRNSPLPLKADREYFVTFWMKNEGAAGVRVQFGFDDLAGTAQYLFDPIIVNVANDWQTYSVGPLYSDVAASVNFFATIADAGGGPPPPSIFLDNILVTESVTNIFHIRDTWRTPKSCDTPVPGAMLGCQTYTNTANTPYNLRSFSRLCSEDVIGCQAFINTHNSDNPFQQIFNEGDAAEVVVPADSLDYIVYREENLCFNSSQGCQNLGLPQFNLDLPEAHPKYIASYQVRTLINDPDTYDKTLCASDALFCEEYTDSRGSSAYFKDPRDRTCVFGENVNIQGELFTGWFQKESMLPGVVPIGCSDDGVLPYLSNEFEVYSSLDGAHYKGWVAECPLQYDLCTEFKDPLDTQGNNTLTNFEFLNEIDWTIFSNPGPAPANWFEVNPAQSYAITRADPYGNMNIYQYFSSDKIQESDIFSASVEVNIRKFPSDIEPAVQTALVCYWDALTDVDYCVVGGLYDYSSQCTKNSDCTSNQCGKFAWYQCQHPGPDGIMNNGNDLKTGEPCNVGDNAHCEDVFGIGSGYVCHHPGPNDPSLDYKDKVIWYGEPADLTLHNTWQTLRHTVDLGTDGGGKEFFGCEFWMSQTRGKWGGNLNDSTGIQCVSSDRSSDCFDSYCLNPGGDTIAGTNDDLTTTTRCSTSSVPGNPGTVTDDAGCISAHGAGYQCGGESEVWWRNPLFKVARGYYYVDDEQVTNAVCKGQVGKKEGCLLFIDMNDRQTKLYDTFATYEKSTVANGGSVAPVVCDPLTDSNCNLDSNRIIKVTRDRQCTEWLSCRSATEVFDPSTNSYRQICDQIGTCSEYTPGTDVMNCREWELPGRQRLEYGYYVNRPLDFDYADYTGFSIYNYFLTGTLDLVDVSTNGLAPPNTGPDGRHPDFRLVRVIDTCDSSIQYNQPCGPDDPLNPGDKLGVCFSPNRCVLGVDGSKFSRVSDFVIPASTRSWAEKDSPFPNSVIESQSGSKSEIKFGFQESNICESKTSSCEERYYKFQYGKAAGGIVKYYSADVRLEEGAIPSCVCQSGFNDNEACNNEDQDGDGDFDLEDRCPHNGAPVYLQRTDSFINWPGFCLERDERASINASPADKACLTWLPVDNSPSGFDFYNQNREAGYAYKVPAYYCMEVGLFEKRKEFYLGDNCSGDCKSSMLPSELVGQYIVDNRDTDNTCGSWSSPADVDHCWAVPIGGNGWYNYDPEPSGNGTFCGGQTYRKSGIQYCETKPDPSCQVMALAVDDKGENAAMTNHFWDGYGGGAGYKIPTLDYKLEQDDKPFGSAVPSGIGIVTDKNLKIKAPTVIPRAGSPFACSSNAASCSGFDQNSGDAVSVPQWVDPGFPGDETYVDGTDRLKRIYKKIFNLYTWRNANICSNTVCSGTTDVGDGTYTGAGSYFGGAPCDPSESNSCNSLGIAACESVSGVCANSIFSSSDALNPLYRSCYVCPLSSGPGAVFENEQTPDKRCRSVAAFTDVNGSGSPLDECTDPLLADFDPGIPGVQPCDSFIGPGGVPFACAVETSGTIARCFSPDHAGNDCKIPSNPDGTIVAAYLSCQPSGSDKTCFYGFAGSQVDTGVPCDTTTNCTTSTVDPDTFSGSLYQTNQSAFCADGNIEGPHDFGSGFYCVGGPFTYTDPLYGITYRFDDGMDPVSCSGGSYTNALGHILSGAEKCLSQGLCLASKKVRNSVGEILCHYYPEGYQPMCDPQFASCAGLDKIAVGALPLDVSYCAPGTDALGVCTTDEASAHPRRSPYIIPTVCNDYGVNCKQAILTSQFDVPDHPNSPPVGDDNGFNVNNKSRSCNSGANIGEFCQFAADCPGGACVFDELTGYQSYLATLKFYMAADKDHMPIRYIEIDWDDGSKQARVGYYKNHFEECGKTDELGPRTDAQSLLEYAADPRGCREGFRSYLHVFAWSPYNLCEVGVDVPAGHPAIAAGASCYRPRVMIQDNWGWCTGGVYGLVGLGCRDIDPIKSNPGSPPPANPPGTFPEPPNFLPTEDAYVEFPGIVIVYKDPQP